MSNDLLLATFRMAVNEPDVADALQRLGDVGQPQGPAGELEAAVLGAATSIKVAAAGELERLRLLETRLNDVEVRARRAHEVQVLKEVAPDALPLREQLDEFTLLQAGREQRRAVLRERRDRLDLADADASRGERQQVEVELEGLEVSLRETEAASQQLEFELQKVAPQLEPRVAELMAEDRDVSDLRHSASAARETARQALLERGVLEYVRNWLNERLEQRHGHELVIAAPGLGQLANPSLEVPTDAHVAVRGLIERLPGGSIGIAGPRGSGKTTLIEAFCSGRQTVRGESPAIGVVVSAPVEYAPRDFMLHLFATVCRSVVGAPPGAEQQSLGTPPSPGRLLVGGSTMAMGVGAAAVVSGLVLLASEVAPSALRSDAAMIAWAAAALLVTVVIWPRRDPEVSGRAALIVRWARVLLGLAALGAIVYSTLWDQADWNALPSEVALGVGLWIVASVGVLLVGSGRSSGQLRLMAPLIGPALPLLLVIFGGGVIAVAWTWTASGSDAAGGAAWNAVAAWGCVIVLTGALQRWSWRRAPLSVARFMRTSAVGLLGALGSGLVAAAVADEQVGTSLKLGALVLAASSAAITVTTAVLRSGSVYEDAWVGLARRALGNMVAGASAVALLAATALVGIGWLNRQIDPGLAWSLTLISGGAVVFASAVALRNSMRLAEEEHDQRSRDEEQSRSALQVQALRHLEQIHYQQTFTSGWSGALKFPGALKLPIGVEAGVSGGRSIAELQLSVPEIVRRFTAFVADTARPDAPVLIGIDELDKMGSETQARDFLNDIKAVFGVGYCYYLISVSEDAVASFERRGLPFRDVFDSSFDEIVRIGHLGSAAAQRVLGRRIIGLPAPYAGLCYCISGGLPRDLIRFARTLFDLRARHEHRRLAPLSHALAAQEFLAKRDGTVAAIAGLEFVPAADDCARWLGALSKDSLSMETLQGTPRTAFSVSSHGDGDAQRGRAHALSRLMQEFIAYGYFLATLEEFFAESLNQPRLEQAENPESGCRSLEQLARARQSFVVDPMLAWDRVTAFRADWEMTQLAWPCDAVPAGVDERSGAVASEGADGSLRDPE